MSITIVWVLISVIWFVGCIYSAIQKRKLNHKADMTGYAIAALASPLAPQALLSICFVVGVIYVFIKLVEKLIDFCTKQGGER